MANLNDLLNKNDISLPKEPTVQADPIALVPKHRCRPWLEELSPPAAPMEFQELVPTLLNSNEIETKLEPNLSQSEAKVEPTLEPNLSQSEAKVEPTLEPNLSQSEAKVEPRFNKTRAKVEPQPEPYCEPKLSQSEAKVEPKICSYAMLVGIQRQVTELVFESSKSSRDRRTGPIGIQHISEAVNTTISAARKAIQRLESKSILFRSEYKNGRGGWSKYELSEIIFREMLLGETRAKVEPKLSQTRVKLEPQLEPQLEPRSPSSSSKNIDINTTTTNLPKNYAADCNWTPADIDLDTYEAVKVHGLRESHLKQLAAMGNISYQAVLISLNNFDVTLTRTAHGFRNPVAVFMKSMRDMGYFNPPAHYAELQDKCREETWKEILSSKGSKAELEGSSEAC